MSSILPLKVESVSIQKRGRPILQNVSLDFSVVGLTIVMGPNGAGKTTLLRVMHGLERPRTGAVHWACDESKARARQAFVFQTPVMMRRSVLDNIAYALSIRGVASTTVRDRAVYWANHVGLGDKQTMEAKNLSGGERQKLAIARALIAEPDILFLDEPTTNLDGKATKDIEAILQSAFQNGTRIVMTTHDIGQAKRLASDVVFLNNGKLCEHTKAAEFFKAAKSDAARAYLKGDIVE